MAQTSESWKADDYTLTINGYITLLMNEHSRTSVLYRLDVLYKDNKMYFMNVTESMKTLIGESPAELGCPLKYLSADGNRKEDIRFPEDIYPSLI
jgi:hypothetical protein